MNKIKNIFLVFFMLFVCKTGSVFAQNNYELNYNNDFNIPQITETSVDITLSDATLNLTNNGGAVGTGKYFIAQTGAANKIYYNNLTWLNNGSAFDLTDKTFALSAISGAGSELYLWYYLNYWEQNDNSFMEYNGFQCVGTTCTSTQNLNTIISIKGVSGEIIANNNLLGGILVNDGLFVNDLTIKNNATIENIYNYSNTLIKYQGNGIINELYSVGGFEFSDMNREAIQNILLGNVIYKGSNTTVVLDQQTGKIITSPGTLTLTDIILNFKNGEYDGIEFGIFNVASANGLITFDNITFLNFGEEFDSDTTRKLVLNGNTLDFWYYGNYWSNKTLGSEWMKDIGFTCISQNNCLYTGSVLNTKVMIDGIGTETTLAFLENEGTINDGISITNINYLFITNNGTINGAFDVIGKLVGNITNSGTINSHININSIDGNFHNYLNGIINGLTIYNNFKGTILNRGIINGENGIYLNNLASFEGEIQNDGTINSVGTGIWLDNFVLNNITSGRLIYNQWRIWGSEIGIHLSNLDITTDKILVFNSGNITSTIGIYLSDINLNLSNFTADNDFIINYAGIGTSLSEYGIFLQRFNNYVIGTKNSILNEVTGVIEAKTGIYLESSQFKGDIINKGELKSSENAILLSDTVMFGDIINDGTINSLGNGISLENNSVLIGNIINNNIMNAAKFGISLNEVLFSGNLINNGNINITGLSDISGIYMRGEFEGNISNTSAISIILNGTGTAYGLNLELIGETYKLENSGNISVSSSGNNVMLYGIYLNSESGGDIINTGSINSSITGSGTSYGIYFNSLFTGNLINSGTINSSTYAIYNAYNQMIKYQGNGSMLGQLYSEGGFEFSGMNRAPVTNITKGTVLYNGTDNSVQLNLLNGEIIRGPSSITLKDITLNFNLNDTGITTIAQSNDIDNGYVLTQGTITLLNNGLAFSDLDKKVVLYGSGSNKLELWYFYNYWNSDPVTGDLYMRNLGFDCSVFNNCTLQTGENIDERITINGMNSGQLLNYGNLNFGILMQGINTVDITNSGNISVVNKAIEITNQFTGKIFNTVDGVISGEYAIYNSYNQQIKYEGGGQLTGKLYSEGGFDFSNLGLLNTAGLTNVIEGSGDIKYSGSTVLTLNYGHNDFVNGAVKVNTGNLILDGITLNIYTQNTNLVFGKYVIADAGSYLASGLDLFFNIQGAGADTDYTYYTENGKLWLWYFANYWTNGESLFMENNGFVCSGENCILSSGDINKIINIKNIGYDINYAQLDINGGSLNKGIVIKGTENYLNINNNSQILNEENVISISGDYFGTITNNSLGIIKAKYGNAFDITGDFNGSIVNTGKILSEFGDGISFTGLNISNLNKDLITNNVGGTIFGFGTAISISSVWTTNSHDKIINNIGTIGSDGVNYSDTAILLGNNVFGNINYKKDIYNSGNIFAKNSGIKTLESTVFYGDIINDGLITVNGASGCGLNLSGIINGDILNSGTISSTGVGGYGIFINGFFGGNIINSGTISATDYAIYNIFNQRIKYQGNGSVVGKMFSTGGFEFSNLNRTPFENIEGNNGIIYKNSTLQLINGGKVSSEIGTLTLNNVILNLTDNGNTVGTGKYLLASSNTSINYSDLTLHNNGFLFDETDKTLVIFLQNNKDLYLWYYLNYWTALDNTFMEYNEFNCTGNNCSYAVDKTLNRELIIKDLLNGNLQNFGTLNNGIVINQGNNVLSITNQNSGLITGSNYGILIKDSTLTGNIINDGRIMGSLGSIYLENGIINGAITNNYQIQYGISSDILSSFTGSIINNSNSLIRGNNDAILLHNFSGNIINDYQITGAGGNGIVLKTITANSTVENNAQGVITGNNGYGLYLQNGTLNVINDGIIQGTTGSIYGENITLNYTGTGSLLGDLFFAGTSHLNINNSALTLTGIAGLNSLSISSSDITLSYQDTSSALTNAIINANGGVNLSDINFNYTFETGQLAFGSRLWVASGVASYTNLIVNGMEGHFELIGSDLYFIVDNIYWIQGVNSLMLANGFTCTGTNDCVLNTAFNSVNPITAYGVGLSNDYATLKISETVTWNVPEIIIKGDNYLNIINDGIINLTENINIVSVGTTDKLMGSFINNGIITSDQDYAFYTENYNLGSTSRGYNITNTGSMNKGIFLGNKTTYLGTINNSSSINSVNHSALSISGELVNGLYTTSFGLFNIYKSVITNNVLGTMSSENSNAINIEKVNFNADIFNYGLVKSENLSAFYLDNMIFGNSLNKNIFANYGRIEAKKYGLEFTNSSGFFDIINSGSILSDMKTAIYFDNVSYGILSNKLKITNNLTGLIEGIEFKNSNMYTDIFNYGEIYNSLYFNNVNLGTSSSKSEIKNYNTGSIVGENGIHFSNGNIFANISNYGVINGSGFNGILFSDTSKINNLNLTNYNGAQITGNQNGIFLNGATINGSQINNFGKIQGLQEYGIQYSLLTATGINGINNYTGGVIIGTKAGIYLNQSNITNILNYGKTECNGINCDGIKIEKSNIVKIENYGNITSSGTGIKIEDNSIIGKIINNGEIKSLTGFNILNSTVDEINIGKNGIVNANSLAILNNVVINNFIVSGKVNSLNLINLIDSTLNNISFLKGAMISSTDGILITNSLIKNIKNEGNLTVVNTAFNFDNNNLTSLNFNNSGKINADKVISFTNGTYENVLNLFENNGIVNNQANGVALYINSANLSGNIVNNGTVGGKNFIDWVNNSSSSYSGNIINNGNIITTENSYSFNNYNGDLLLSGNIINNGVVESNLWIAYHFYKVNFSGQLINNSGARITGGNAAIHFNGSQINEILNYGNISGQYGIRIYNSVINKLYNAGVINTSQNGYSIEAGAVVNTEIKNDGTLSGISINASEIKGDIINSNSGNITKNINVVNNSNLQNIINNGKMNGVSINNSILQNIVNNNTMRSIVLTSVDMNIFTNEAEMLGYISIRDSKINGFNLSNTSNIQGYDGIIIDNITGDIVNSALIFNGKINAIKDGVILKSANLNESIINNADINAGRYAFNFFDKDFIFENNGNITSSDIAFFVNGNQSIINNGTIQGTNNSFLFEASDDTLNYSGKGSLSGKIDMGQGVDIVNIQDAIINTNSVSIVNASQINIKDSVLNLVYNGTQDTQNAKITNSFGGLSLNNIEFNLRFTQTTSLKDLVLASANLLTVGDLGTLTLSGIDNFMGGAFEIRNNVLYYVFDEEFTLIVPQEKADVKRNAISGISGFTVAKIVFNNMEKNYLNLLNSKFYFDSLDFAQESTLSAYDFKISDVYKVRRNELYFESISGTANYDGNTLIAGFSSDLKGWMLGYNRQINKFMFEGNVSQITSDTDKVGEKISVDYTQISGMMAYTYKSYYGTIKGAYITGKNKGDGENLDVNGVSADINLGKRANLKNNFMLYSYAKFNYSMFDLQTDEMAMSYLPSLGIDLKYILKPYKYSAKHVIMPSIFAEYGYEFSKYNAVDINDTEYPTDDLVRAIDDAAVYGNIYKFGASLDYIYNKSFKLGIKYEKNIQRNYEFDSTSFNVGVRF